MVGEKRNFAGKHARNIRNGLLVAMQTELEGYEFYKMVASKTKDAPAREMFTSLANDELEHHRTLKEHYGKLIDRDRSTTRKLRTPKTGSKAKSPVFSREFLASRRKKHLEMSALSLGILLEQNSINFYREQSKFKL